MGNADKSRSFWQSVDLAICSVAEKKGDIVKTPGRVTNMQIARGQRLTDTDLVVGEALLTSCLLQL